jgi:hypothetical protein
MLQFRLELKHVPIPDLVKIKFWESSVLKNRAAIFETCPKTGTGGHSISPLASLTPRSRHKATWTAETDPALPSGRQRC